MEALDYELFELKNNFEKCQKKLEEVEREHRQWEIRSSSLREEEEVE